MTDVNGSVLVEIREQIAIVTLHRPEKLNALTPFMLSELGRIAEELDERTDIRVAILTASGVRAFCVGADIKIWSSLAAVDMWRSWVRKGHKVFDRWSTLRVPLIAAINGHAFGGGLELLATSDIRITDPDATFSLPEAGIATCPGWSGTQRLVQLIGPGQVKYMALTGIRLDAHRAWEIGLVQEISDPGQALNEALMIAEKICAQAPVAVQLTRQIIDAGLGNDTAMTLEALAGALSATTDDAREGLASFSEKRKASYQGK
ncbi:enoyl-CoA hydratase/isomerase family protein [Serratia ficaria]|uniref:enoyl-CoA hydratase/isomerase family protein n=1 Tax=Serratia ficaria TaxID=61651 RepID=UPI00217C3296|nr:enoyl-CoA hydratase/isomerase family protein [Serratia ficaria]CAI0720216.1 Probable enoyl-CoA hydratase echA8 [Serratia ficaria]CAI1581277.1 Probable enoyl-CoA hydratase echA8 [Serratia ficaria]